MKFRTEITPSPLPYSIDYQSKIFGMGSCFVDNIKEKFDYYKFQNLINPFETVFNPVAIQTLLQRIVNQQFYSEKDLFYHENVWKHFDFHTKFNRKSKKAYIDNVNNKIKEAHNFLFQSQWVFFTFGTAWVYRHKKSGKIVNNCHKIPQKEFDKILLSPTDIINSLQNLINLVNQINQHINIVFTLSPVRHLKDGFTENQLSKSRLFDAIQNQIDNKSVFYFPSYEIMMDDLRDYRFYKPDLIHPNEMAVNYIWDKFKEMLISPNVYSDMQQIEKIQKQLLHKQFVTNTPITTQLQNSIEKIQKKYQWIKF